MTKSLIMVNEILLDFKVLYGMWEDMFIDHGFEDSYDIDDDMLLPDVEQWKWTLTLMKLVSGLDLT